jgi:hypothetical protein
MRNAFSRAAPDRVAVDTSEEPRARFQSYAGVQFLF